MAQLIEVRIPDIGGFSDIPIIELAVQPGASVAAEDTLLTLESDKATVDVPAPVAGVFKEWRVKVGDKVSQGAVVAVIEAGDGASVPLQAAPPAAAQGQRIEVDLQRPHAAPPPAPVPPPGTQSVGVAAAVQAAAAPAAMQQASETARRYPDDPQMPRALHLPTPAERVEELAGAVPPHATPSIRLFARELGVDLTRVAGSGPKGRITREDVQAHVKSALAGGVAGATVTAGTSGSNLGGMELLAWPKVDFSKFGPVEVQPLSRIKRISGANLARNWVMIPHVTQFDEADIGALEELRVTLNKEHEKSGVKLTMLAFLVKAVVAALKRFPEFNASLEGQGEDMRLVLKRYYHIGFAADTPNGLVVPVIRDADQKGLLEIAGEMSELAGRARAGKLAPADMQGGCFSISSLGGIGGTAFTPIINAPEVAILGVSKSEMKPVWNGSKFKPRLMLPLSLSYDHRVIDGAAAARFTSYLASLLADMRRVLL